jgi:hypothetical protein
VAGDVDVPKVGKVDPKIVIPIVVVAAGFVAWRYYSASQDTGAETTDDTGDFGDGSAIPSVIGAVSPDNSYGIGGDSGDTTQTNGGPSTNAEWSNQVADRLSSSDTWSYTDIVSALGNYLSGRPLTTLQQTIVQAAIAVGGYPPVGSHSIVTGGNTAITVAPTGLRVVESTSSSVTLTFNPVAGADRYQAYRGVGGNVGTSNGTTIKVVGLQPDTPYQFYVKAVTASGTVGPESTKVTGRTKDVSLATPATPAVSSVTKTSAHVTTRAVTNATGYNWYINGVAHGHSDGPAYTVTGLKSKTTYRVTVAGDTATRRPGHASAARTFKTK